MNRSLEDGVDADARKGTVNIKPRVTKSYQLVSRGKLGRCMTNVFHTNDSPRSE